MLDKHIDDHNQVKTPLTWADFLRAKNVKTVLMAQRKKIIADIQRGFMSDDLTRRLEENQVQLTRISKEVSDIAKHMGAKSIKAEGGILNLSGKLLRNDHAQSR